MSQISASLLYPLLLYKMDWKTVLIIAICAVVVVVVLAIIIGAIVGVHIHKKDTSEYVNSTRFYFLLFLTL